jgi:predicted nucleotidyltransferase
VPQIEFDVLLAATKKAAAALREAGIPFVLAGGIACWARGGPATEHDVDLCIRKEDADGALEVLEAAGMRTERPPEQWLVKAYDGEALIDLIFEPAGNPVGDEIFDRADELSVEAVRMPVMAVDDILVTKLMALTEHHLDYDSLLELARPLREQITWDEVRRRTAESPYARAFFTLADGLGVSSQPTATA